MTDRHNLSPPLFAGSQAHQGLDSIRRGLDSFDQRVFGDDGCRTSVTPTLDAAGRDDPRTVEVVGPEAGILDRRRRTLDGNTFLGSSGSGTMPSEVGPATACVGTPSDEQICRLEYGSLTF